jgi:hypothetical protein
LVCWHERIEYEVRICQEIEEKGTRHHATPVIPYQKFQGI